MNHAPPAKRDPIRHVSHSRRELPARLHSPNEGKQIFVHLVLVGRAHAVRRALVDLELCTLDDLDDSIAEAPIGTIWSSSPCRIKVGTSNFLRSSVVSVSEKHRDAEVTGRHAGHHAPQPERVAHTFRDFRVVPVAVAITSGHGTTRKPSAMQRFRQLSEALDTCS